MPEPTMLPWKENESAEALTILDSAKKKRKITCWYSYNARTASVCVSMCVFPFSLITWDLSVQLSSESHAGEQKRPKSQEVYPGYVLMCNTITIRLLYELIVFQWPTLQLTLSSWRDEDEITQTGKLLLKSQTELPQYQYYLWSFAEGTN